MTAATFERSPMILLSITAERQGENQPRDRNCAREGRKQRAGIPWPARYRRSSQNDQARCIRLPADAWALGAGIGQASAPHTQLRADRPSFEKVPAPARPVRA